MIDFSKIPALCQQALGNWQDVVTNVAIIVSMVITIVGFLKSFVPFLKNMKNKDLRKTILAVLSLAMVLPVTAFILWVNGYSFDIYWYCVYPIMLATIIVYWFYEVSWIRKGIKAIGGFSYRKLILPIFASFVDNANKETREKLVSSNKELKDFTKEVIKSSLVSKNASVDKDLENL